MRRYSDVVGNINTKNLVQSLILSGGSDFIILQGPSGHGKSLIARITAAFALCEFRDETTKEPCGECASCKNVFEGINSTNFILLNIGLHSDITVIEDLKELVKSITQEKSVVLLEELQELEKDAQAAMLGVLDSINSKTPITIIGTTNKISQLIPTIQKRSLAPKVGLNNAEIALYIDTLSSRLHIPKDVKAYLLSKHLSPREIEKVVTAMNRANTTLLYNYFNYFSEKSTEEIKEFINAFCKPVFEYVAYINMLSDEDIVALSRNSSEEIVSAIAKNEFSSGKKNIDFDSDILEIISSFSTHEAYRLLYYIQKLARAKEPKLEAHAIRFEYEQSKLNTGFGESLQLWREENKAMYGIDQSKTKVNKQQVVKENQLELSHSMANFGTTKFTRE